jgi:hypothetical protein
VPADKYGYQPAKEVGTFGKQIKYATLTMKVLLAQCGRQNRQHSGRLSDPGKTENKEEIITPPDSR